MNNKNNRYGKLVQAVFDELGIEGFGEDGDQNIVQGGGWLEEHDRRYHNGRYEEGQTCKLREKLGQRDQADRLGGASIPDRSQFNSLIQRLSQNGSISDDECNEINEMMNEVINSLANGDDESGINDEQLEQVGGLLELYNALNDAFPEENTHEGDDSEPDNENVQENGGPTESDIQEAVNTLMNAQNMGVGRDTIEAEVRRMLDLASRNQVGAEDINRARDAITVLGENDPVVRAIRNGMTHLRPEPMTEQAPQPAQNITLADTLPDPNEVIRGMNESLGATVADGMPCYINLDGDRDTWYHSKLDEKRGQRYEWPAGRNRAIDKSQITPDLIENVVANLPTGYGKWRNAELMSKAMKLMRNPEGVRLVSYGADRRLRDLLKGDMGASNVHAKRFRELFKTLHPEYLEKKEADEQHQRINARRNAEERNFRNFATAVNRLTEEEVQDSNGVDFSEDDATDAANRIAGLLGENFRVDAVSAMQRLQQNHCLPTDIARYLAGVLPSNHSVMTSYQASLRRREQEKKRRISEAKKYKVTTSEDVSKIYETECAARGFRFLRDERAPYICNHDIGHHEANCYINTICQRAQKHGVVAKPKPGWGGDDYIKNQTEFAKRQMAYADNFTPFHKDGVSNIERIKDLKATLHEGDSISCWDGGHNVLVTLQHGRWYKDDGYYGDQAVELTDAKLAYCIVTNLTDNGYEALKINAAAEARTGNHPYSSQLGYIKMAARHKLMKEGRNIGDISAQELDDEMRKFYKMGNESFIIPANAPLLPEEWALIEPYNA